MVMVLCLTLSGCFTMNERWATSSLYRIRSETFTDISGTLTFDRMLLHRRLNPNRILLIERATLGQEFQFAFVVDYLGPRWIFLDYLLLRIDDGDVITLGATNTVRNVISSGVNEIVRFALSDELVEQLLTSSSLAVQFAGDLNNIPPEGISALQDFIRNSAD